ncbi:MAG: hypothetical protein Q8920_17675 [Bacillota bacterium]|nr:hypothetical protein [Bacillota bacterium]
MFALNASSVRKEWGGFIDSVVREKPQVIKRSRDYIFATNIDQFRIILKAYTFSARLYTEEDGSITVSLNEIDIVANGKDKEDALLKAAQDLKEYAEEYYSDFETCYSSPNRKSHLPYVLNVLCQNSIEGVKSIINA